MVSLLPITDPKVHYWKNPTLTSQSPLFGLIGNTPLLRLPFKGNVEIFAKAEWMNPGGSIKDRVAMFMMLKAMAEEKGIQGKTILDATSGNTGIALAMLCASLNIPLTLCIPSNASKERLALLKAYGANLILTDPSEGTDGSIEVALQMVSEDPQTYLYLDQYSNDANWQSHYYTTAEEIWNQTNGNITHFVAGLGTTGTFTGTMRKLKKKNPEIVGVAVQPSTPLHGLEGLKHIPTSKMPPIFDSSLVSQTIEVGTEEAYEMTNLLAKKYGLLVGVSSGAAVVASLSLSKSIDRGSIITVLPDRGDRYLSESLWRQ